MSFGQIGEVGRYARCTVGARCRRRLQWLSLLTALCSAPACCEELLWVLVDTSTATLSVMRGEDTVARFTNISLGREGTAWHRLRGDNKTPLGVYRISWIEPHSAFHRFFGLNYPTLPQAYRARDRGHIDERSYQRILAARRARSRPPQKSALGGNIGIHGLGKGDPWIHAHLHWTNGCIALTDDQIDQLSIWIDEGTQVIIR